MADLKDETCESTSFLESKKIKCNSVGGDDVGNMKTQISTSRVSDYQASESVTDNVHGSTLVHEDDKQSTDGFISDQPTSAKSDLSTETGLNTGNFETDGLNTMKHEMKHRTESSCSNSLSVVLPASEASKEANSLANCGGSMDSSHSKAIDPRLDEPVTTSSESGVSAQIAHKAINNALAMSSMKTSSVVENSMDPDKFIAGFDLNEDINTNEMDDCFQPAVATASSPSVIHVIAKAAIRSGQPKIPLKLEGGLGWKGSAETRAFRPTRSVNTLKDSQGFTGIDLNVAAVEDSATNGSSIEHHRISLSPTLQDSRSEVDAKGAKSLWFDLNHLYDDADEFVQRSLPAESENPPSVDLNLNANASVGNKTSHYANPGKWDSNFTSGEAKNAHMMMAAPNIFQPTELMQRVASLQQKSSIISHTLPATHYYTSTGPFHFSSGNPTPVPFTSIMPYARYSHEHGIFPQVLNHDTVHKSFGTPHLVQVVPNERDIKTDVKSSTGGNNMDESRKFMFLGRNSTTGEMTHQEAWCAKRKEPEGGLECYYKQMI
ncbi:hypothetical protein CDL12_13940 [Handroanthus impetiginosus]|uniref:Uncharacterized protein n=1 Tax=Handroanthus impetiginosus TaxID=429701 RepID=A0A2G9H7E5_9LAMI|nr:hypothetical protein CDL12_13940 [Handroanthus impetiginosus]